MTIGEEGAEQGRGRRGLVRKSLGAVLKAGSLDRGDLDRCQSTAAAFVRAWRYRNATDQCLVRSIAMRAMLARRGLGSDLVIGVMLPSSAHCWIPVGAAVLSDPLDLVVYYQPLLTVRSGSPSALKKSE